MRGAMRAAIRYIRVTIASEAGESMLRSRQEDFPLRQVGGGSCPLSTQLLFSQLRAATLSCKGGTDVSAALNGLKRIPQTYAHISHKAEFNALAQLDGNRLREILNQRVI